MMCTILARYMKADLDNQSMAKLNALPDASGVSSWATSSVAWALNNEVIHGVDIDGVNYVQASTSVTREMAAQVIANASFNNML